MSLLDRVQDPAELRRMSPAELTALAQEIREFLIATCSVTGGHIGAGLGVVELTIALHTAFNTPDDKLDVIARLGGGYTYCVARAGVTGAGTAPTIGHQPLFAALAERDAPPPVLGFGISSAAHVRAAAEAGAAGVICGSAIVQRVGDGPRAVTALVRELVAANDAELKKCAPRP